MEIVKTVSKNVSTQHSMQIKYTVGAGISAQVQNCTFVPIHTWCLHEID